MDISLVRANKLWTPADQADGAEDALQSQLTHLLEAKSAPEHELRYCQEQVNLMFAITRQVADLREPEAIRETLLRHYATMLRTEAVYMDGGGCCQLIKLDDEPRPQPPPTPDMIRTALAAQIEAVRVQRRGLLIERAAALGGAPVLLGPLPQADGEVGVVIALRARTGPPFNTSDMLASESVLVYGTQVLRNAAAVRNLQRSALETVCALVNAIDAKDNYTSDHSERVGGLARLTGEALELPREQVQTLEWAGLLHDVGKIGIAEQILNKPGRLTDSEFAQMKQHPRIGYEMLKPVARFEPVLQAVLYHHENEDGSGYPEGRGGDEIPLDAQIIHVADVFDALTTSRPYRAGYSLQKALRVLEQEAGRVTNVRVTQVFIAALRNYLAVNPSGFRARFSHLAPDRKPN